MGFINSQRGQFFSPDMIIATGVFLLALAFFWTASSAVFAQSELLDKSRQADEVSHLVMNSLVLSPGSPGNWTAFSLADVNAFGLARQPSVLNRQKVIFIINYLNNDSNYLFVKEKLGAGPFDFQLSVLSAAGTPITDGVLLRAGRVAVNPQIRLVYRRMVDYAGQQATLEGIFSLSS